jgi:hypothetical protein
LPHSATGAQRIKSLKVTSDPIAEIAHTTERPIQAALNARDDRAP